MLNRRGEHSSKDGSHLDLSFRQYAASLPVFIRVSNNSFILHAIIQKLKELNDVILISINFINLHPYSCPSSQALHILAQTAPHMVMVGCVCSEKHVDRMGIEVRVVEDGYSWI